MNQKPSSSSSDSSAKSQPNPYEAKVLDDQGSSFAPHENEGAKGNGPLLRDASFWGMTATQFLGAFNDNLFKQLMLLLAIPAAAAVASSAAATVASSAPVDLASTAKSDAQGVAMMVFSLPFVIFSGFAGYLSDRYSKQRVILLAKWAEVGIMLLGLIGFLCYPTTGYSGLLVVLFLMGVHSAFFGPGKYGILPELFRKEDLARANGIILMTTFLAIILGTASAGFLGGLLNQAEGTPNPQRLWIGSAVCMGIAFVGSLTAMLVRQTKPAAPDLKFTTDALAIPPQTRQLLAADRSLLAALLASCLFWLVCGVAMTTVNSLGKTQLGLSDQKTSLMTAVIGIGIAVGAVGAGKLSSSFASGRIVIWGAWGIILALLALSISLPTSTPSGTEYKHLLGFYGSLPALIVLGGAAGLFAIPVQVFIQTRPPENQKGQTIATMNLTNFIAIFLSGAVYFVLDKLVVGLALPRSLIFLFTALLVLPVAIVYRPDFKGTK